MAAKGMAALFNRVQANPKDERLLNRVLSLISDIRNVPERAAAALEFAAMIVEPLPREAMRLAHMVYRADRNSLQALEVVIACLRKLGRVAKAEILANELRKLHGLQRIEGPPDADRQVIMTPRGRKASKKSPALSPKNEDQFPHAVDDSLRQDLRPGGRGIRSEFSLIAPIADGGIQGGSANNIPGFSELDLKDFSQIAAIANAIPDDFVPDPMPWGGAQKEFFPEIEAQIDESGVNLHLEPARVNSDNSAGVIDPKDMFPVPIRSNNVDEGGKKESPRHTVLSINLDPSESPAKKDAQIGFNSEDRHTHVSAYRGPHKLEKKDSPGSSEESSKNPKGNPAAIDFFDAAGNSDDSLESDSNEDMVAAAELFDYYWQQGFMREARDLLNQTAAICSEAHWWRARKNLLRSSRIGRMTGAAPAKEKGNRKQIPQKDEETNLKPTAQPQAQSGAPPPPISSFAGFDLSSLMNESANGPAPGDGAGKNIPVTAPPKSALDISLSKPLSPSAFWPPLQSELASLTYKAESLRGLMMRSSSPDKKSSAPRFSPPPVPKFAPEVSGAIETIADSVLLWDMVQALWGEAPGQDCIDFLKKRGLTRASTGFWGCYMYALLGTSQHRFALHEVRAVLKEKRLLPWANAAYARLPIILDRLSVRSIVWEEAEGVQTLIDRVGIRQPPLARGLFVAT